MLLLSKSDTRKMVQCRLCGKSHVTGGSSPREGRETQAGVFQKITHEVLISGSRDAQFNSRPAESAQQN